jgi:hypothetical protein
MKKSKESENEVKEILPKSRAIQNNKKLEKTKGDFRKNPDNLEI